MLTAFQMVPQNRFGMAKKATAKKPSVPAGKAAGAIPEIWHCAYSDGSGGFRTAAFTDNQQAERFEQWYNNDYSGNEGSDTEVSRLNVYQTAEDAIRDITGE